MLLSVAILFLLYAVRETVDVPTVCFVLTWVSASLSFLGLEIKVWRRFKGKNEDEDGK